MPVKDIRRQISISTATFYQWKSKYGGLEASKLRRIRELEAENWKLKRMYAELALDNAARTRTRSSNASTAPSVKKCSTSTSSLGSTTSREATHWWMIDYNEERPRDSLSGLTTAEFRNGHARSSTFEASA